MNKITIIRTVFLFFLVTLTCAIIGSPIIADLLHTEKLVIDTDGGGDDIITILLVLLAYKKQISNYKVVGITCTYGNTDEKSVEKNVLEALTLANESLIPVYGGAQKPLASTFTSDHFFGIDGFGDFKFDKTITAKVDESMHAAMALVQLAKKYQGQLNILSVGPQTNIAMAIALDSQFIHNVKRFYIMGGSVSGIGNIKPADIMCAAVMMWPDLITKSVTCNVSPILEGEGKGAVMVDYFNRHKKFKNAQIIQELQVSVYQQKVLEVFS
ncbi:hypothetical protein PV328_006579 [Microctonus aethiopoides]|uniref:Inosine/uridine-preferring nucleoside hydrolase domain-containing protein n=1 Tax=Microctonus aethiopoides TaxID=144406 RepID=A0AA39FPR5_9HYME|nr:hypothetical protein PV328_006579 [Microctonus aethiopoides]